MPDRNPDGTWQPFNPGARPSPKDIRDFQLAEHHPEIATDAAVVLFPSVFSLRQFDPGVDDQGQLGSCTAFGSGNAFEMQTKRQGLKPMAGSKLAQYYWTRAIEGTTGYDSGAYVRDAIKALAYNGYAPVSDWIYYTPNFRSEPPLRASQDALGHKALKYVAVPNDVNSMKAVLSAGYAVIVGFTVYTSFFNPVNGIVQEPFGRVEGGHCVRLIGWDDYKGFEFANSWSAAWGAGGYAYLPYDYLPRLGSDFWMISEVTGEMPVPVNGSRLEQENRQRLIEMLQRGDYLVPDLGWVNGVGQHGSKITLSNGADPNPAVLIAVT